MDALSEVLTAVRVTGAFFFNGEFSRPWRFATRNARSVARALAPGTDPLVVFHLVTQGSATAHVAGQEDVPLAAGDIVLFPHGDAHELWDGRTPRRFDGTRLLPTVRDRAAIVRVTVRDGGTESWIERAIIQAVAELESGLAGRCAVLAKLAEAMFAEALCRYMGQLPPDGTGWLAAARDPVVGQALGYLHRRARAPR